MSEEPASEPDRDALLEALGAELSERGLETAFRPGDAEGPGMLLLDIGGGGYQQLFFYPGLDEPWMLVHYLSLPVASPATEHLSALCELCNLANAHLPLGHLGVIEDPGELYFRYTSLLDAGPVPAELAEYLHGLGAFVREVFGPLLDEVAGGLELDEARRRLDDALEQLAEEAEEGAGAAGAGGEQAGAGGEGSRAGSDGAGGAGGR